jgi:hypothetical protein
MPQFRPFHDARKLAVLFPFVIDLNRSTAASGSVPGAEFE